LHISGSRCARWQRRALTDTRTIKASGLTWSPNPLDDAAAEHAVTLLRVAEASWVEDCPEVPPPVSVIRSEPALSAHQLDADSESLEAAAKAVAEDWQQISERQRACSRASGSSRAAPGAVRARALRR